MDCYGVHKFWPNTHPPWHIPDFVVHATGVAGVKAAVLSAFNYMVSPLMALIIILGQSSDKLSCHVSTYAIHVQSA